MKVWVSDEDVARSMGSLPAGLEPVVGGVLSERELAEVTVWVPPYLGTGRAVAAQASRMPALRLLQLLTAGYDDVVPHVPPGVGLCNAWGVHDASTAEHAVALTLASLRGLDDHARAQQQGSWRHDRRPALADRTVLIVGYGGVGAAVDRRLAGFEVDVLRVARTARDGVAGVESLPELLPHADVVILTVPLTPDTRGMVDTTFLARMKDGALLVNVARGAVVDTEALLAECTAGRLRAALDVTDPEPLPVGHPLWRAPGVLVSPHVGGDTSAFPPRAALFVVQQLRRYAAGEPLAGVVIQGGPR